MAHKIYLMLVMLFISTSCAQFETGRSFLTEMEHDDSHFFHPNDDFPVVAGDSGRYWNSNNEQAARTPSSPEDMAAMKRKRAFERELRELESAQSENASNFYDKYKDKFSNTSEKIYFLNLPYYERKDYLLNRGFIEAERRPASLSHKLQLIPGMKKEEVIASWGNPSRVDYAGRPQEENERWLYQVNGASKYVYFEAGTVQGWE